MDEYTDYSCSTSLERLARDVETIFRSWHVNDSDRHVSLSRSRQDLPSTNGVLGSDGRSSSLVPLRSESLPWEIGFYAQQRRISYSVTLHLKLWDCYHQGSAVPHSFGSPATVSTPRKGSPKSPSSSPKQQQTENHPLPFSLTSQGSPTFGLEDFSELFGIGQHITLTPAEGSVTKLPVDLLNEILGWVRCDEEVLQGKISSARAGGVASDTCLHHDYTPVHLVRNVLSTWLQTALNLAVSASQCAIPVFGLWTSSYGADHQHGEVGGSSHAPSTVTRIGLQHSTRYPTWMMKEEQKNELEYIQKCWSANKRRFRRRGKRIRARNTTPRVFWSPNVSGALFSPDTGTSASFSLQWLPHPQHHFFWTWGDLLLAVGPYDRAAWVAARHVYEWRADPSSYARTGSSSAFALSSSSSDSNDSSWNWWRPPLSAPTPALVQVLRTLEHAAGCSDFDNPLWGPPVTMDPIESISSEFVWRNDNGELVQFPLKIRSKNFDQSDMMELQMSLASTLLNPTQGELQVRATYPPNIPATSMAASLRCCLAALIRAATLPPETLVSHLVDPELVLSWDNSAGNAVAQALAQRGGVSPATQALVAAMDWETTACEVITEEDAIQLIQESVMGDQHDTFTTPSIPHSAPPGRLVSVLCTHMTSLRSLCSMAVVWCTFCQELREQWEQRRSLLNLHTGIAPTTSAPETMGAKSTNAGQLNSLEPNPDLSDVLIQQKLQVLNVCVECQNAIERVERRALEQRVLERRRDDSQASDDELFFDSNDGVDESDASKSPNLPDRSRLQSGNGPSPQRRGARCPVQGSTLRRENSQLYAPYLQRPVPLTGDVITERRVMMERQKHTHVGVRLEIARRLQEPKLRSDMQAFKAANPGSTLEDFLAWYGNPKNPMDEFMNDDNWAASSSDASVQGDGADDSSVRSKSSFRIRALSFGANPSPQESRHRLDRAAEAIRALEDTRDFWQRTWNAADPVAADEQQPLFDAANTVERVFDYLETLHPASLLCQVMAANLCTSFFVLTVSAGDATNLVVVQRAFESVRASMEHALKLLSDSVVSSLAGEEDLDEDVPTSVLTVPTIAACERACAAFSEAEVLLSRASSLLNKFPGRYELVEIVLTMTTKGPASIDVRNPDDRMALLDLVESQQRGVVPPGECPEATVRDYLLRSLDSPFPSQLLVRQCSERDADGTHHGSLALAIAKCSRD